MNIKGFTLIELLIVIALLGVLATTVVVVINPFQQFAKSRDSARLSITSELGEVAIIASTINGGTFPDPASSTVPKGWLSDLKNTGDLTAIPASIPYLLPNSSSCISNPENNICYNRQSPIGPVIVYARLEAAANIMRCGADMRTAAWAIFSSTDGRGGVVCSPTGTTTEPTPGTQIFYDNGNVAQGGNPTPNPSPSPTPPTLSPSPSPTAGPWVKVTPGGSTKCARGGTYSYWYKVGSVNNLMFFFQGGGSCFDAVTCAQGSGSFQDQIIDVTPPNSGTGIFDTNNASNPVANWNIVYIPYCTGDLGIGSNIQTYTPAPTATPFTIYHYGFINSGNVVNFAYSQFPNPNRVLVAGCSAGGAASTYWAPYIMQHYSSVPGSEIADSGSMVFPTVVPIPTVWNASGNLPNFVTGVSSIGSNFNLVPYAEDVANYFPSNKFGQINHASDTIQANAAGMTGAQFNTTLISDLNSIEGSVSNFKDYTIPGTTHCITTNNNMYTTTVSGSSLVNWITSYLGGNPVTVR